MPRSRIAVGVLLFAVCAPGRSTEPLVGRGTRELSVHVSPDFGGAIGDTIFAEVGFGWFVTERLQVQAAASYEVLEDVAGEDSDYRAKELDLIGEYHFATGGALVPHAGLAVGWASSEFASRSESGFVYGPRAGLDWFLADNVALGLDLAYKLASTDLFVNDFVAEDTDLTYSIGLRFRF